MTTHASTLLEKGKVVYPTRPQASWKKISQIGGSKLCLSQYQKVHSNGEISRTNPAPNRTFLR